MRAFTIALLWFSVAAIAAYWLTFFAFLADAGWDPGYVAFERAFPPADAVLACSAAATAEALRRRRALAVPLGLFSAGQFCFLGLLDVTYALQNGGYNLTPAMLAELAVNLSSLGMAGWLGVFLWRCRQSLGVTA